MRFARGDGGDGSPAVISSPVFFSFSVTWKEKRLKVKDTPSGILQNTDYLFLYPLDYAIGPKMPWEREAALQSYFD